MFSSKKIRCLGIDPGSINFGFGLIEANNRNLKHIDSGCFKQPQKFKFAHRLESIIKWLDSYLLKSKPTCIALEEAFVGKYAIAALQLGHVRGAIMTLAFQHNLELFEYPTRSAKKIITGSGGAKKCQIQFMVRHFLQDCKLETLDQSDALAMALTHIFLSCGQKIYIKAS